MNVGEARRLLARGLDRIVLRGDEAGRLWAEVRGNLAGILELEGLEIRTPLLVQEHSLPIEDESCGKVLECVGDRSEQVRERVQIAGEKLDKIRCVSSRSP